ncbi:hypothetical protein ABTD62_22910, partial [Acinetobacter baumannii]
MKVHNYNVWGSIDDYAYWYDSRYDFSSCAPSRLDLWNRYTYGYTYNFYNGNIFYCGGWYG